MSETETKNHWNYTILAESQYGETYGGRRLIGRDMDVRGGVYYGTYRGEAIVIDPEKYPDDYDEYYDQAVEQATRDGKVVRSEVLRAVFDTISNRMKYSQSGVDEILHRGQIHNGEKLELSVFMHEGVGVCRHQALACAALLERFKDEGHIRGDISVDRNENSRDGGHAWVRYTSKDGLVQIMDVAQGYFGLLRKADPTEHWDYFRPADQVARPMGKFALKTT